MSDKRWRLVAQLDDGFIVTYSQVDAEVLAIRITALLKATREGNLEQLVVHRADGLSDDDS